jgi:iron complex outermembrane receptor protein
VLRFNRLTLDADVYFIRAQNAYTSAPDPITGEPVYFLGNDTLSKGFELESNVFLGHGFNLYLNGTIGSAKYDNTHLWVANSPKDTETTGLFYLHSNWDIGFFNKRIGQLYNDAGAVNQGVFIHPFNITNAYFNYTIKNENRWKGTKIRLALNNLFDQHNITGVTPGANKSLDTLTLMAGRSVSITTTFGYVPGKKH